VIIRNHTPFRSNVRCRRRIYLVIIKRRLRRTVKDVGAENDFVERPWLQLMCCAPVSSCEVGRVFQSEGSRRDRGPKELSEGVRVNKMRLGPDDVNLQTEELHCNYSVLIGSPE